MTFWSLHSGYRAKQCSLGVLPACVLARAVPNGGNVWLNIDFARARKLRPGENCRMRPAARQKLPLPANYAEWAGQILPLFRKVLPEKSSESKENPGSRRNRPW